MAFDELPDDELTWPYVQRYLALRAAKRIGAVWPGAGGIYWLAPADALDPWDQLGPIPVPKLRDLIDALCQSNQIEEGPQAPPKIAPGSSRYSRIQLRRYA